MNSQIWEYNRVYHGHCASQQLQTSCFAAQKLFVTQTQSRKCSWYVRIDDNCKEMFVQIWSVYDFTVFLFLYAKHVRPLDERTLLADVDVDATWPIAMTTYFRLH